MANQADRFFIGQNPTRELLAQDEASLFPTYELNIRPWLPTDKAASILDFGCGYGTFLRYLKREGYSSAQGFDPDTRCANFSGAESGLPVTNAADSFSFLEQNQNQFESIVTLSVVSYFERDRLLHWFSALKDSLRPGGNLIFSTFNGAGVFGTLEFIQDPFFKTVYTDILIEDICREVGFEIMYLGGMKIPPKGLKRKLWLKARFFWTLFLRFIYVLERGASERNPKVFDATLFAVLKRAK